MKTKLVALTIFVVTTILTMSSCSFLRGIGSTTTDTDLLCLNYQNADESQLEIGLIHEMTRLYRNSINKEEVRAVRLDLETLKKFIYHIEIAATKNNVPSEDLGIRIYYARYPDDMSAYPDLAGLIQNPITRDKYPSKHTVVMIPTKKKGNIHQDFDPYKPSTYNNGFTDAYSILSPEYDSLKKVTAMPLFIVAKRKQTAQNHGALYPPYATDGMNY